MSIDDNENISIKTEITEIIESKSVVIQFSLLLEKIEKRSNGFVQYKFQFNLPKNIQDNIKKLSKFKNETDHLTKFREYFQNSLSKPIYHYIKEFYHKHETITNKDYDLAAICFEEESSYIALENNSHSNDNKYLQGFLDNFEEVFKRKAYQASELNFLFKETYFKFINKYGTRKEKFDKEEKSFLQTNDLSTIPTNEIEIFIANLQQLNDICEDTLIEYTYCKTLLHSIYNKFYRHDTEGRIEHLEDTIKDPTTEDIEKIENLKRLRRKALNIRNSVRYIEDIKYKNQNRQYFISRILLAKVQEKNDKIETIVNIVREQNTHTENVVTEIEEQNVKIGNVLENGNTITNISIAIAIYGLILTILSIFEKSLSAILICKFNLHICLLSFFTLTFAIALLIIWSKRKKQKED
ncbi:MAG: hypothetical protein FWD66_11115 [Paludibacter sp.]|nr:hypothetical protein [Paludibacter sp.]